MSTNWFIQVGCEENHVIVAGCQIHYAVKSKNKPNTEPTKDFQYNETHSQMVEGVPCRIYIAE